MNNTKLLFWLIILANIAIAQAESEFLDVPLDELMDVKSHQLLKCRCR
jgi:hypothetical protein